MMTTLPSRRYATCSVAAIALEDHLGPDVAIDDFAQGRMKPAKLVLERRDVAAADAPSKCVIRFVVPGHGENIR